MTWENQRKTQHECLLLHGSQKNQESALWHSHALRQRRNNKCQAQTSMLSYILGGAPHDKALQIRLASWYPCGAVPAQGSPSWLRYHKMSASIATAVRQQREILGNSSFFLCLRACLRTRPSRKSWALSPEWQRRMWKKRMKAKPITAFKRTMKRHLKHLIGQPRAVL